MTQSGHGPNYAPTRDGVVMVMVGLKPVHTAKLARLQLLRDAELEDRQRHRRGAARADRWIKIEG
jgi:hypothetical protein